jgi:hypothetical protein
MNRHILTGVVVFLAVAAVAAVAAQAPSPVERELVKLENGRSTAEQKKDAAFVQKLFAKEYFSTDSNGG